MRQRHVRARTIQRSIWLDFTHPIFLFWTLVFAGIMVRLINQQQLRRTKNHHMVKTEEFSHTQTLETPLESVASHFPDGARRAIDSPEVKGFIKPLPPPPPQFWPSSLPSPSPSLIPIQAPTPVYKVHTSVFDVEELCRALVKAPTTLPENTRLVVVANYQPSWKCGNSSLGNMLSIYVAYRTLALLAGADFVVEKSCTAEKASLQAYLPLIVKAASRPNIVRARGSCDKCRTNSAHICTSGWPEVANLIVPGDLRNAVSEWEAALKSKIVHDEVAIHIRCGDTFKIRNPNIAAQYGLLPYSHYHRIIPPNVSSIGINTQSLNPNCNSWVVRKGDCDGGIVGKCRRIVKHLAVHLRTRYPSAAVTIRDGEPVALAYSRLINAPIATICNPSTFCLWPTLASNHGWLPFTNLFRGAQLATQTITSVNMMPRQPQFLSYQQMQRMHPNAITEILERR